LQFQIPATSEEIQMNALVKRSAADPQRPLTHGGLMKQFRLILLAVLSGLGMAPHAQAHHAFSAEYDAQQVVELTGVVTKVEWTNPHVRFYIDVEDADGQVTTWDFELQSVNTLTRAGWSRNVLKTGDVVTVVGYLARNGTKRANARGSVTKADGTVLFAGDAAGGEQ
jgi:hypothetical protein